MSAPTIYCAVNGLRAHRAMCAYIGCGSDEQGRKACHYKEQCQHQRPLDLGLAITPYPVYEQPKHSVYVNLKNLEHSGFEVVELHNGDPYAATRRAIVRAAAAIGATHLAQQMLDSFEPSPKL